MIETPREYIGWLDSNLYKCDGTQSSLSSIKNAYSEKIVWEYTIGTWNNINYQTAGADIIFYWYCIDFQLDYFRNLTMIQNLNWARWFPWFPQGSENGRGVCLVIDFTEYSHDNLPLDQHTYPY